MINFAAMDEDGIVTQVGAVSTEEAYTALEDSGLWIVRDPPAEIATGRWQRTAEGFFPSVEPEMPLTTAAEWAIGKINALAGQVRRLYVTDIPGQEAIYLMKQQEAKAWVASADPDPAQFPLISAEVGITGSDADQVAQVYLNLAGLYLQAAAQLETARLGHIAMIEAATTGAEIDAALAQFQALIAS